MGPRLTAECLLNPRASSSMRPRTERGESKIKGEWKVAAVSAKRSEEKEEYESKEAKTPGSADTSSEAKDRKEEKKKKDEEEEASSRMTEKQKEAFRIVTEEERNAMITGGGGTGKSWLIHRIVARCRRQGKRVAVTAMTGLAASHIEGRTIHSWSGLGVGTHSVDKIVSLLSKYQGEKLQTIRDTDVLIIDEISMASASFLDKLDVLLRRIRGQEDKPMGGLQLVLVGDMLQIPPISEDTFVFDSMVWNELNLASIELTQIMRQKEQQLRSLCEELRFSRGRVSESAALLLDSAERPIAIAESSRSTSVTEPERAGPRIVLTKLFATNSEVHTENSLHLRELKGKEYIFKEHTMGEVSLVREFQAKLTSPPELRLKTGAIVLYCMNSREHEWLVNGSLGEVVGWSREEWPIVLFKGGRKLEIKAHKQQQLNPLDPKTEVASRTQLPLILAWACTIDKCQGMTLEYVEIDFSRVFGYGRAYVAISRASRLDGLRVLHWRGALIQAHPRALDWYLQTFRSATAASLPLTLSHKKVGPTAAATSEMPMVNLDTLKNKSVDFVTGLVLKHTSTNESSSSSSGKIKADPGSFLARVASRTYSSRSDTGRGATMTKVAPRTRPPPPPPEDEAEEVTEEEAEREERQGDPRSNLKKKRGGRGGGPRLAIWQVMAAPDALSSFRSTHAYQQTLIHKRKRDEIIHPPEKTTVPSTTKKTKS